MKKLICILSMSLLIAACNEETKEFTQTKIEPVSTEISSTPAEVTPLETNKEEDSSPIKESVNTEEKTDKQEAKSEATQVSSKDKDSESQNLVASKVVSKRTHATVAKNTKSFKKEHHSSENTSNLSEGEIKYEKMQCRYPYMTEQEKRENHCYNM